MSLDFLNELLTEATDDAIDTTSGKKDAINNDKSDIKNGLKDDNSDANDVSSESDTGEEENSESPEDVDGAENTDDSTNDTSSDEVDIDSEDQDGELGTNEESVDELRKKNIIYDKFINVVKTYKNLENIFNKLLEADTSSINYSLFNMIKDKVNFNLSYLDKLMLDEEVFLVKSYAELLVIYNIYMTDIRVISNNLNYFIKANKELNTSNKKLLKRAKKS